jgi:hypothetical protein
MALSTTQQKKQLEDLLNRRAMAEHNLTKPGQSVEYWGGYLDAINLALRFASGQSLEQIEALPVWKQIKAQGQLF